MRERLLHRFGPEVQELSLPWDENTVTTLLAFLSPAHVLEVGTHRGGSSSLFARCGSRVTTIDQVAYPLADEVWQFLGVSDRIERRLIASEPEKHALIADTEFDFALLDAAKGPPGEADFRALSRCHCVLMRDYTPAGALAVGCRHRRKPEWVAVIDSLQPPPFIFGYRCSLLALLRRGRPRDRPAHAERDLQPTRRHRARLRRVSARVRRTAARLRRARRREQEGRAGERGITRRQSVLQHRRVERLRGLDLGRSLARDHASAAAPS